MLRSFLYDAFTARKAKAKTHRQRSARLGQPAAPSAPTTSTWKRAPRQPEEIIKEVKNGFYVTAMLGRGADLVTGDYSRGANGMWIENGELA